MDLVLGPYTVAITGAVADVTERHRMPMVAANVASIHGTGRRFLFGMASPAEVYLEGLIDLAAKKGLKTVALIDRDLGNVRATIPSAIDLAKKKGLRVAFVDAFPPETTDFSTILTRVRAANPDVLGVVTNTLEDGVAITRQMKALNVNPRMVGLTAGVDLPKFYEVLGRDAEFVYGATAWVPELVELRAGGLIPIARQYPRGAGIRRVLQEGVPRRRSLR